VQSGILHGAAKMIDGMVEAIRAEMREPAATVLATGGLAPVLAPRCGTLTRVDSNLTLRGLLLIDRRLGVSSGRPSADTTRGT
jgi:type III pantothenate kinase